MTIRLSSAMLDEVVANWGVGTLLSNGHVQVFSGAQPPSADDAPTGDLLATITTDGLFPAPGPGGLKFALGPEPGQLIGEGEWVLKGVANGEPGWWRFVRDVPDDGSSSDELCRVDGSIDDCFVDMPTEITNGLTHSVGRFLLILPDTNIRS